MRHPLALPTRRCWLLMLPAIALNITLGHLVVMAGLPLYLDLIGTVVLAAACGPMSGLISGGATLLLWSLIHPDMWVWAPVAMGVGFVAGLCARGRLFIAPAFSILAGFFLALTATAIAVPLRLLVSPVGWGETLISTPLIEAGKEMFSAILSASFLVELADKATVCLVAWLLLRLMPRSWLGTDREVVNGRPGIFHPPVTSIITGYLALFFLYSTFFVTMILSTDPAGADPAAHTAFQNITIPLFQQACVLLSQYGHWTALALVALTFLGVLRAD